MVLKICEGGSVQRRALYLAWASRSTATATCSGCGLKFWMQVLNDLKQRGVQDILICCVDGLTGFPEALPPVGAFIT